MRDRYKAVEVFEPGRLRVVERSISEPTPRSGSDSGRSMWNLSHRCGDDHGHLPGSRGRQHFRRFSPTPKNSVLLLIKEARK